jgi:hypothetical protein
MQILARVLLFESVPIRPHANGSNDDERMDTQDGVERCAQVPPTAKRARITRFTHSQSNIVQVW